MSNNKGSLGQSVVTALVVGLVMVALGKLTDHHDETATATSIATLTANVANLGEQVRKLTEQPYVRRDEFQAGVATIENRVSGLDGRINQLEQRDDRAGRKRGSP